MNLKRIIATLAVLLLVSAAALAAGRSDLADAVMKGDKAAVLQDTGGFGDALGVG